METLWNLYQERLNQLNQTFLNLLQEFQNNSLFKTPQLSKYRLEYLADIIEKTLKNNQQKLILKLYQQIDHIKSTNLKLQQQAGQRAKNQENQEHNGLQFSGRQKSLGSTKVSTVCTRKQKQNNSNDLFLETCPQKLGRKERTSKRVVETLSQKQKQKLDNQNQNKKNKKQTQLDDDDNLSIISSGFKYLKL